MNRKRKSKQPETNFSNDKMANRYLPKTDNHTKYLESIIDNQITLIYGPAGSGKSAMALSLMCEHLVEGKIDKLIITKPFVESSPRGLGYLRGGIEEKTAPYLTYFNEYLDFLLGVHQHRVLVSMGKIEVIQIEYIRGRTFNNAYIFGDEFQNATQEQCKLLVSRLGINAKVILAGDPMQTDLIGRQKSGFGDMIMKLDNLEGVGIIKFERSDIMRNGLLGKILERLEGC